MSSPQHIPEPTGRLAYRLAVATALCAIPLVLFGGSVTTLGAGMAVEGWLVAEGHFMVIFPIEKWFRDVGTFVEHTHRLFGVLVGFAAIATLIAAWRERHPRRFIALAALLAVCAQGALGGFRVLENSPSLAFLHGTSAQLVFALLCLSALLLRTRSAERHAELPERNAGGEAVDASGLQRLAWIVTAIVFAQITLGAWYRHGLRPEPMAGIEGRLHMHLFGAIVVFAAVAALRVHLKGANAFPRAAKQLAALLGIQILLGAVAWLGYHPNGVAPIEWICSVLHVLVGALLLARCLTLCVMLRVPVDVSRSSLSGAGGVV